MSVRLRIVLVHLVITAAILGMAACVVLALRGKDEALARTAASRQELEGLLHLTAAVSRYSEELATTLQRTSGAVRPAVEARREQVRQAFADLRAATESEINLIQDADEREQERQELTRLDDLRQSFVLADGATERLLRAHEEGRSRDAVQVFRTDIVNRLGPEWEVLVGAATADERREVARVEFETATLTRRLDWIVVACSIGLALVSLSAGLWLYRSLHQRISALQRAAEALGQGNLDHRIRSRARDELGQLARRLDVMAAELQNQQALLLEAQAHLEQQVAHRTEELATANRRVIDLDRMRSQFLADISHELRTPLTILRGEAEVTLRSAANTSPETYRDTLRRIAAGAQDMSRLVEDLLFIARSEADQIRFEFVPMRLTPLLHEACQEGRVIADRKGVDVLLDISGAAKAAMVRADPGRLKQALLIVVDNAVKYSSTGQTVLLEVEANKIGVEILVRDQGCGVRQEDVPYVFERFYRTPGAKANGGGLGLAIAKWIVDKHEGQIALNSDPDRGTEVRLMFPQLAMAAEAA
jgi:signal transduction histidine kinase